MFSPTKADTPPPNHPHGAQGGSSADSRPEARSPTRRGSPARGREEHNRRIVIRHIVKARVHRNDVDIGPVVHLDLRSAAQIAVIPRAMAQAAAPRPSLRHGSPGRASPRSPRPPDIARHHIEHVRERTAAPARWDRPTNGRLEIARANSGPMQIPMPVRPGFDVERSDRKSPRPPGMFPNSGSG